MANYGKEKDGQHDNETDENEKRMMCTLIF